MSNNKQSSIDWLEEEFVKLESTIGVQGVFYELLEQAKAMHKQEIIRARLSLDRSNMSDFPKALNNATDYYNETFGGNNENI